MPVHDFFESDKKLQEIAENMAPALTEVLDDIEMQRYGFMLYVIDMKEGLMQYISDQNPHDGLKSMEMWCARRKLDLEKKDSQ